MFTIFKVNFLLSLFLDRNCLKSKSISVSNIILQALDLNWIIVALSTSKADQFVGNVEDYVVLTHEGGTEKDLIGSLILVGGETVFGAVGFKI